MEVCGVSRLWGLWGEQAVGVCGMSRLWGTEKVVMQCRDYNRRDVTVLCCFGLHGMKPRTMHCKLEQQRGAGGPWGADGCMGNIRSRGVLGCRWVHGGTWGPEGYWGADGCTVNTGSRMVQEGLEV